MTSEVILWQPESIGLAGSLRRVALWPLVQTVAGRLGGVMRIEMLVFDGMDEMDVMGPFEVWSHAARRPDFDIALVGLDGPAEVTGLHGLQFKAPEGLRRPDALLECGAEVADGIAGAMEYTRDRDVYVSK